MEDICGCVWKWQQLLSRMRTRTRTRRMTGDQLRVECKVELLLCDVKSYKQNIFCPTHNGTHTQLAPAHARNRGKIVHVSDHHPLLHRLPAFLHLSDVLLARCLLLNGHVSTQKKKPIPPPSLAVLSRIMYLNGDKRKPRPSPNPPILSNA
ncbi:hypothetical protein EJ04DRAFT_22723 [Polyplosphaeria fusca]|uniref:Uncharacterized protein n=1 Tax=Polyplosphaeria fusca TaxID=682080 RepID=A0A9P4R8M1_9PLEO|nr:hypothetical protein EJ04DRAFT_22723 [Polyplosphaeria fusca]